MAQTFRNAVCHCLRTANRGAQIMFFLLGVSTSASVSADVIVLANRTKAPIPFRFVPKSGAAQQLTLPAGDTMPLFLDGKADITFSPNGGQKHYSLDANCAYFFGQNP